MLVPLSLCCPSRVTILRGQYPHNSQVVTNALPLGGFEKAYSLNLEAATVATTLHAAGYRTVLFGKYLNGYPDTATPTYIPPGWDEWFSPAAGNPYSEYNYTLNENGTLVKYGGAAADYLTDVIYLKAVDFITRAGSTPGTPLFMYFATYAPHAPYTPAPRHANAFPGLKAPKPPSFNEPDVSDKPAYVASRPLLTSAEITSIDTFYRKRAQALQAVDEAIEGLVNALAATNRLANTYIFFAADNGYHMGNHRLLPGKYTPYDSDLHVPLVVRGPGVPAGVVRSEIAANVDLAETFANLAGVMRCRFPTAAPSCRCCVPVRCRRGARRSCSRSSAAASSCSGRARLHQPELDAGSARAARPAGAGRSRSQHTELLRLPHRDLQVRGVPDRREGALRPHCRSLRAAQQGLGCQLDRGQGTGGLRQDARHLRRGRLSLGGGRSCTVAADRGLHLFANGADERDGCDPHGHGERHAAVHLHMGPR